MQFNCHNCGTSFQGPPGYTGDLCQCPYCGTIVSFSGVPVGQIAEPPQETVEESQYAQQSKMINCPDCGRENSVVVEICCQCGRQLKQHEKASWLESCLISKEATVTLIIGLIMALIIVYGHVNFLRFIMHHFLTLVHEFGHSLCGWMFGYFSVPAFDFTHGGGVAVIDQNMNIYVRVAVYLVLGWCIYTFRRYKMILAGFIIIVICLALCQIMNWDELAILYMGHGTVAIMGGVFLFRGMSNVAVHHVVERVLYFFLAFFVLIEEFVFSRKIINNPGFRDMYLEGKGGIENDFHRIGDHLHMSVQDSIAIHSIVCIVVPVVTYLIYILAMRNYSR